MNFRLILNKYPIPNLICNKKIVYDVTHLYKKTVLILKVITFRDENCYRSFENKNLKNILVIGGSTTDQRYINEGETFQDILDKKFDGKYDFINAGVDGQSSYMATFIH